MSTHSEKLACMLELDFQGPRLSGELRFLICVLIWKLNFEKNNENTLVSVVEASYVEAKASFSSKGFFNEITQIGNTFPLKGLW